MDGKVLYYGKNTLSDNVNIAGRKKLKSANGMYLESTGSGKSFAVKRERGGAISFLAPGQQRTTQLRSSTIGEVFNPRGIQNIIVGKRLL